MQALGLEPHLNTSFKHFVLFVREFEIATSREFWGPLAELVEGMCREGTITEEERKVDGATIEGRAS